MLSASTPRAHTDAPAQRVSPETALLAQVSDRPEECSVIPISGHPIGFPCFKKNVKKTGMTVCASTRPVNEHIPFSSLKHRSLKKRPENVDSLK